MKSSGTRCVLGSGARIDCIYSDICEKSRSCRDALCNTENGRMIVELYLGKQEHHVSRILC